MNDAVLNDERLLLEFNVLLRIIIRKWGVKVPFIHLDLNHDIVSITFRIYEGDFPADIVKSVNIQSIRDHSTLIEDYAKSIISQLVAENPKLKMGFFLRLFNRLGLYLI